MLIQTLIATLAVFLGMVLNYFFHFYMTRTLTPALYGELSVLIAIFNDLIIPAGVIQILLTREIAKLDKNRNQKGIINLIKRYTRNVFLTTLFVSLLVFFSSYFFARIFNDNELVMPIKILSMGIPFAFLVSIVKAYYQGKEKSNFLSALVVIDPLLKVCVAIFLISIGFKLLGAVIGLIVSPIILSLLVLPLIMKKCGNSKYSLKIGKSFAFVLATQIILMFFFYIDLFFVRYYLGAEQAGYYNAASITSKVIAYSTGGLSLVLYPKYSKMSAKTDKNRIKRIITKSILFIISVFTVFMLFPRLIISVFYTEKYLVALPAFIALSIGMFLYAVFRIFVDFMWSQKQEFLPFILSTFALILDIVLLNYLVPKYGLLGGAMSTVLTSAALLLPALVAIKKMIF